MTQEPRGDGLLPEADAVLIFPRPSNVGVNGSIEAVNGKESLAGKNGDIWLSKDGESAAALPEPLIASGRWQRLTVGLPISWQLLINESRWLVDSVRY